ESAPNLEAIREDCSARIREIGDSVSASLSEVREPPPAGAKGRGSSVELRVLEAAVVERLGALKRTAEALETKLQPNPPGGPGRSGRERGGGGGGVKVDTAKQDEDAAGGRVKAGETICSLTITGGVGLVTAPLGLGLQGQAAYVLLRNSEARIRGNEQITLD